MRNVNFSGTRGRVAGIMFIVILWVGLGWANAQAQSIAYISGNAGAWVEIEDLTAGGAQGGYFDADGWFGFVGATVDHTYRVTTADGQRCYTLPAIAINPTNDLAEFRNVDRRLCPGETSKKVSAVLTGYAGTVHRVYDVTGVTGFENLADAQQVYGNSFDGDGITQVTLDTLHVYYSQSTGDEFCFVVPDTSASIIEIDSENMTPCAWLADTLGNDGGWRIGNDYGCLWGHYCDTVDMIRGFVGYLSWYHVYYYPNKTQLVYTGNVGLFTYHGSVTVSADAQRPTEYATVLDGNYAINYREVLGYLQMLPFISNLAAN